MKKDLIVFMIGLAALIAAIVWILALNKDNDRLKEERDRYKANTEVLNTACEHYKVSTRLSQCCPCAFSRTDTRGV